MLFQSAGARHLARQRLVRPVIDTDCAGHFSQLATMLLCSVKWVQLQPWRLSLCNRPGSDTEDRLSTFFALRLGAESENSLESFCQSLLVSRCLQFCSAELRLLIPVFTAIPLSPNWCCFVDWSRNNQLCRLTQSSAMWSVAPHFLILLSSWTRLDLNFTRSSNSREKEDSLLASSS